MKHKRMTKKLRVERRLGAETMSAADCRVRHQIVHGDPVSGAG